MKRSLAIKSNLVAALLALLLFSCEAFAGGVKVEDGHGAYVSRIVTAENVKGVEVRLAKEIIRGDCNMYHMDQANVLVSGNGKGWYDKFFFDVRLTWTKMHCPPLDKPVNETIYTKPVFIKSFVNKYVKNGVVVTIVIPDGYKLDVREVE